MARVFQVIEVKPDYKIKGFCLTDPIEMVKYISKVYNSPKNKDRDNFIYFKPYFSCVVAYPNRSTKFVEIMEDSKDEMFVNFRDNRPDSLDRYKVSKGYIGRYFTKCYIIDFITGEVIEELQQEA